LKAAKDVVAYERFRMGGEITDPAAIWRSVINVQVTALLARICWHDQTRVDAGGERLRIGTVGIPALGRQEIAGSKFALCEGKNRQIRASAGGVGVQVLRLVRVSIGPLELGELKEGSGSSAHGGRETGRSIWL